MLGFTLGCRLAAPSNDGRTDDGRQAMGHDTGCWNADVDGTIVSQRLRVASGEKSSWELDRKMEMIEIQHLVTLRQYLFVVRSNIQKITAECTM